MKQIKFTRPLSQQILTGTKTTTWRLFDDKDLKEVDLLELLVSDTKEKFAEATILKLTEKTFSNLTNEDWEGHGKFSSDQEMYETYSRYYNQKVTPQTKLKIIKFRLS